ncbi:RNA polymerase sigma factor [Aquisphaera insulae]|uniref:RNA polymerase sigma factor n=1 Tax=Aquisphaera insulae TaxID=2712864 RepID=UPI0013EA3D4D|nr:RNA polymerase sigma factor [Aquisphaera insulae]
MQAARDRTPDLVRLFDAGSVGLLPDNELLNRFVVHRDRLAFESLVSRLGPMVLGVCRRQLGESPEVDDCFQATFLVLIRRGPTLGPDVPLGAWLHGVAVRVARQARKQAARRVDRERAGVRMDVVEGREPGGDDPELRRILDEEIARLPDRYRLPVILCYLEGITHAEAARRLGWPLGSVKGRLSRARSLLQSRLTRRGVAVGTTAGALAAGGYVEASIPAFVVQSTCNSLLRSGSGAAFALSRVLPQSVSRLAEGVLHTMVVSRLGQFVAMLGVSGLFLAGAGVMARQGAPSTPRQEPPRIPIRASATASSDVKQVTPTKVDVKPTIEPAPGVRPPLNRAEREALDAARDAFRVVNEWFRSDPFDPSADSPERVQDASKLLRDVELSLARTQVERTAALDAHADRLRDMARVDGERGHATNLSRARTRAYYALAALQAEQARSAPDQAAAVTKADDRKSGHEADGTRIPGRELDVKSREILTRLDAPIPMNFPNETPLEEIIKYLKQTTQGPKDTGIPIYLDPVGLEESEKSLTSPVSLDLEGVPLRYTLRLLLRQLGLIYEVKDGVLIITSPAYQDIETDLSRKKERLERGEMTLDETKQLVEELKLRREALRLFVTGDEVEAEEKTGQAHAREVAELRRQLRETRELVEAMRKEKEAGKKTGGP